MIRFLPCDIEAYYGYEIDEECIRDADQQNAYLTNDISIYLMFNDEKFNSEQYEE